MAILQDVFFALRTMRKNPGFAAVTILTLALGIGMTTTMFSVIHAVLLRPLPFRDPSRLVLLFQTSHADPRQPVLLPDFDILNSQARTLQSLAVYYKNTGFSRVTLTGSPEPEMAQGGYVSARLLPLLDVAPLIGRAFTQEEESRRDRVVVLSHALWQRRFAPRRDLTGLTIEIDGAAFQVIGVMPPRFQFPARETQFWAPLTTNRRWMDQLGRNDSFARGFYARWNVVARLKPGVTNDAVRTEMSVLAQRLQRRDPLNKDLGLSAIPLQVELSGNTRLALLVLFGAVFFVLLISCANAAHLMLARGMGRGREMAVRIALGAGTGDLVRQMLAESLVLSLIAGAGGSFLAVFGIRALIAFGPRDLPRLDEASINPGVLLFALAVSLVAAILVGLLPASRVSRTRPHESLRSGGRGLAGATALSRTRRLLVVMEFALTMVLLAGAGLLIRSFLAVQAVDPGFAPEHVLTLRVTLPAPLYEQALERVRAIPGVRAAGAINGLFELDSAGFVTAPGGVNSGRLRVWATWKAIRGDYLEAMSAQLVRGRRFGPQDRPNAPLVAIVDESMARRYWPGENPIGKQFRGQDARGRNDDPLTVIGVVRDSRSHGLESQATPHVFQPVAQSDLATPDLVIRTSGEPMELAAMVRDTVRSLSSTAVISNVTTVEQQLDDQVSPRRFHTWLLTIFSLLALLLASVGIYGVMHYSVTQRRHEIGIRMAVGARAFDVLALVLQQGLRLALPGLAAGLIVAHWLTQFLGGILFGVTATDAPTYIAVTMLLLGVATIAVSIPAWRAARVEPLVALRHE